jgi:hypothetical protein
MSKAEDMVAPSGDGTNNTTVVTFTLDATARNVELPAFLYGEFIRITPFGANVYWYLSRNLAAAVDRTVTPSAGTAKQAANLGSRLADGFTVERLCPYVPSNTDQATPAKLYLVYQGDAAGTVLQIEKGSGRPYTVTADI